MTPLTNKESGSNVNQKSSNVCKEEFESSDAKNVIGLEIIIIYR